MNEYIDRNALYEHIKTFADLVEQIHLYTVLGEIRTFPAADVEPVRHGKWEHTHTSESYFNECWRCSVCGFDDTEGFISNYCPNCGAKMMEE